MDRKGNTRFLCLFFGAVLLFLAALGGGGCGGSSGGSGTAAQRYVLVGSLTEARFDGSDLTSYIRELVTESIDIAHLDKATTVFADLTARDIVFLGNADETLPEDFDEESALSFYAGLLEAYRNGATIVAVYPDSADAEALKEMLDLDIDLSAPDSEASDPHFELLGVARRVLPNGAPHTFVYLTDSDSNYGDMASGDETISVVSDDGRIVEVVLPYTAPEVQSEDIYAEGYTPDLDAEEASKDRFYEGDASVSEKRWTTEEVEAELHAFRLQCLLDWAAGLDREAQDMVGEVDAAEAKLRAAAAANSGTDILSLVSGVTTTQPDNVSWSFNDYYEKFGKNNANFQTFADKSGCDSSSRRDDYWSGFKISRHTFSQYRVISLHSFDDHCDYYLVISQANTQPQSIAIRADKGEKNGDEVRSGAYHYALVLGATKGLYTDVQRVYTFGQRVHHLPDQTVNKGKSYTDTNGWSLGGGVSFKAGVSEKQGPYGEAGVNFSASVSHTSSTTWQGQDYEIIPKPNGVWLASWLLDVDYPDYSGGWQISTAAKSSVTLNTESIWRSTARNFALKGRAVWHEGFSWCHDHSLWTKKYSCALTHYGSWKTLSLPRPPRIALETTSVDGGKEGKMYSTKLYTEGDWSAKTDVDWRSWESASGPRPAGTPFYDTVSPNDTGRMRTGNITVASGTDTVTLKFVQSPYSN